MLPDYAPLLKTFLFLFCEICVALSILQPAKYREIWKNQYENQQLLYYMVKFKDIRDLMNLQFLLPRCVSMPDMDDMYCFDGLPIPNTAVNELVRETF